MALNYEPDMEVSMRTDTLTQLLVFPLAEIKTLLASDTAIAAKLALAALERVHHRHHNVVNSYARYRRDNPSK